MRIASSIVLVLAGTAAGIALVMSCGDDAPTHADAAVDGHAADAPKCDCPASEPPIAGRVVIVTQPQTIAANSRGGQGAACPVGSQLLSGSCTTETGGTVRDVILEQSGFYDANPRDWHCFFRNNEATPVTIKVSLICLTPAP
jgi:hypothetical protein